MLRPLVAGLRPEGTESPFPSNPHRLFFVLLKTCP